MNETGKKREVVRGILGGGMKKKRVFGESFEKKKREGGLYAEKGGHRRGGTIQGAVEARIEVRKEGLEAVKEQRVGAPRWRGVYACG